MTRAHSTRERVAQLRLLEREIKWGFTEHSVNSDLRFPRLKIPCLKLPCCFFLPIPRISIWATQNKQYVASHWACLLLGKPYCHLFYCDTICIGFLNLRNMWPFYWTELVCPLWDKTDCLFLLLNFLVSFKCYPSFFCSKSRMSVLFFYLFNSVFETLEPPSSVHCYITQRTLNDLAMVEKMCK